MSEQVYDGKKTVGGVVPTIEQKGQSLKKEDMDKALHVIDAVFSSNMKREDKSMALVLLSTFFEVA